MSKNTQISELINYLSVDGSGNIVITGSLIGPAGATYATQSYVSTNYLGLSGGTLTGALNATTISTSGSATFGSDVFTYNNGGIFFSGGNLYSTGVFQNSNGLNLQVSGSPVLKLAYTTGAATFTGSIYLINANTRISSDGNGEVGINYGTITTSSYTFSLYNNTTRTVGFTAAGAATFSSYLTANGYYVPNTAEQGFATLNGSNGMLLNGTSGYVVLMSGGNETIYLSNTGKVGIGTTSPSVLLQLAINGGFPVLGTNHTSSNLFLSSANRLWGMYFGLDGNSGTGWIQQMRNDGATAYPIILQPVGGNVGIGLTTPYYKLHVQDSTNTGTIAIGHNSYPGLIYSSAVSGEFRIDNRSSANAGFITFYPNGEASTVGNEAMRITSSRNIGIGTTSPSHKLQVSGNIYSTDTVFGRNLKPEAFASVSAGSPSGATIPYGYSMLSISTPCDNNWRAILTNINDTKAYFWASIGDAASKDTANYFMSMTSPGYGVYNFGTISYQDNGWNTGSFEFSYDNSGNGTHRLLVRCSSYYNSGNTAYGNIYFLRIE